MNERDQLAAAYPSLSIEWRREALSRIYVGLGTASRNSGTKLVNCLVPIEAIDQESGKIVMEENTYKSVIICDRKYPAHTAVLMLAHNRHPLHCGRVDIDEVGMHLCNNPSCRRIDHLKLGTRQEDSDYKVFCGRAAAGPTSGHVTMPAATPRGNLMPHCKLREPMRTEAISLLKKYAGQRGFARAIAERYNTTRHIIYNLCKDGAHLEPGVPDTDITLDLNKWVRREGPIEKQSIIPVIREIRQRFHDAPIAERSALLMQFEVEYGRSGAWIRKVIAQYFYPDATPDIPCPENFGIGRRIHKRPEQLGSESDNE
ncbi:MAG: hypothetical protein WCS65_03305 [Verrucomicrobiae bacterium]